MQFQQRHKKSALKKIIFFMLLLASNALAFEIEGVPFIQQDSQFCGPAALASVLSYYGAPVDQKIIGSRVYSEKLQGALITDLERYARDAGFETNSGQGTVEGLKAEIDRQAPRDCPGRSGFLGPLEDALPRRFRLWRRGVHAHDGFSASKRYRYDEFREIWGKMGNAYLLVYKRQ